MLAVKLFTDTPHDVNSTALSLAENGIAPCGIEVGLYSAEDLSPDLEARIMNLRNETKVLHSYLREIGLDEISNKRPETLLHLENEMLASQRMGISTSVVHTYRNSDESVRIDYPDPKIAARQWAGAALQMFDMGMRPLVEKTFESLPWLKAFFSEWNRLGIASKTGFCLDIGHSRVWHRVQLELWLDFTKYLRDQGFAIHFHIHGNAGDRDSHRPLHLAHDEGLLAPSTDWAPRGVIPWLCDAMREHPDSLFTLESKTEYAISAFKFAINALEAKPTELLSSEAP